MLGGEVSEGGVSREGERGCRKDERGEKTVRKWSNGIEKVGWPVVGGDGYKINLVPGTLCDIRNEKPQEH